MMEFHVSRTARDRYQFDQGLFSTNGHVVFADFRAALNFAKQMHDQDDPVSDKTVQASHLNAMGLIDELLHIVIAHYRKEYNPHIMGEALDWIESKLGRSAVDKALKHFITEFPPLAVYHQQLSVDEYLVGSTHAMPNREIALEEMLMLWLSNTNPAFEPYLTLFEDTTLKQETVYNSIIEELYTFFDARPGLSESRGHEGTIGHSETKGIADTTEDNIIRRNLIELLQSPSQASPYSLFEQLAYIQTHWTIKTIGNVLLNEEVYRLLISMDFIKEEEKPDYQGPGPSEVLTYDTFPVEEDEEEHYSPDQSWMPNVVILAKNTYVWLDQLSKKYQMHIARLDQIPEEELSLLAHQGFTSLWLIGLWERSPASQRIKHLCGNPDAVSSAYSILDYDIAHSLGGEDALQNLKERAAAYGIRLASDMVPNHMGIDSRWVIEHPDWFLSLDESPYPVYTFNGENLSGNDDVGIFLEDHYLDRSDAAVVFKRVDFQTGEDRYIYHGNDGTHMPWNDTAQLNFLNPDVREAVIQTILHVARQFPVIRFDAAMTLTRRHYQRLWFPDPGSGGAVPSRAEHGMSRQQFHESMPIDFWREVVDRVAEEAPDTLLLAEAFWLMESYFVRTLGMHRVYNSAFMNMLRDEENAKYRQVMKNTLEFDPEILKRFVNFMNNPDEDTAVDQFGMDDKYFGVCTLLITLPGTPMFGHGQIEGLTEKYGMEYHRAYKEETPNQYLIDRHEREIFPLLHRRPLFTEAAHFYLYDFWISDGQVDENVFVYSNRHEDTRGLVIYNNAFSDTSGWIKSSVAYMNKASDGHLVTKTLGEGLGLSLDETCFTMFRDHTTNLTFIYKNQELHEKGLYVELGPYKNHVFLDFQEVVDDEIGQYTRLTGHLNGRGVPDIEKALDELRMQPVIHAFSDLVNINQFQQLKQIWGKTPDTKEAEAILDTIEAHAVTLAETIVAYVGGKGNPVVIGWEIRERIVEALALWVSPVHKSTKYIHTGMNHDTYITDTLSAWLCVHLLGRAMVTTGYAVYSHRWLNDWPLGGILIEVLEASGLDEKAAEYRVSLIKILTACHEEFLQPEPEYFIEMLSGMLQDTDVQKVLQVNQHQDKLWYNKETFEQLLWWLFMVAAIIYRAETPDISEKRMDGLYLQIQTLEEISNASDYQMEKLIEGVEALRDEIPVLAPGKEE